MLSKVNEISTAAAKAWNDGVAGAMKLADKVPIEVGVGFENPLAVGRKFASVRFYEGIKKIGDVYNLIDRKVYTTFYNLWGKDPTYAINDALLTLWKDVQVIKALKANDNKTAKVVYSFKNDATDGYSLGRIESLVLEPLLSDTLPAANKVLYLPASEGDKYPQEYLLASAKYLQEIKDAILNGDITFVDSTAVKKIAVVDGKVSVTDVTGSESATSADFQLVQQQGTSAAVPVLTVAEVGSLWSQARQYWLDAGASAAVLDATQITIGDLPAGVAGQTQNNQITLSADGAGWGWFVDSTPALSEEFALQTNATLQANPDTAASGKLDLLTVMIHELGHRLGLAHDSAGAMEGIVQAGERQLPSAAEIALMQNIHDAITAQPLTGAIIQTRVTQYEVVANPAFIDLVGRVTPADATQPTAGVTRPTGWDTQGSVDVVNGTATLNEISTAQTRLSQVFMLGANDRYLSFTLSGSALNDPLSNFPPQAGARANGAAGGSGLSPSDAFEVALLDANTGGVNSVQPLAGNGLPTFGASVLGTDGMTRSDAFLNTRKEYAGGYPAA